MSFCSWLSRKAKRVRNLFIKEKGNSKNVMVKDVLDYPVYRYCARIDIDREEKRREESLFYNEKRRMIVWQFWWQGIENAPELVKRCMSSVERYTKNYCDRIILTKENIQDYIEIPKYIYDRLGVEGSGISITHFSDYLRVSLLEKYGGIWIDATCYMTQIIPKEILDSELFYFKSPVWVNNPIMTEDVLNANLRCPLQKQDIASGSNWFIVGAKNNYVLRIMKMYIEAYWRKERELLDYFLFHHILSYILIHDERCMEFYKKMPGYSNIPPHLMQFSINEKEEQFQFLSKVSFIHKLTYFSGDVVTGSIYYRIINDGN